MEPYLAKGLAGVVLAGVSFKGVLFCMRLLSVEFKPVATRLVNVEFKSVFSLDTPRAVEAPLDSTPLMPALVLDPAREEARSVSPSREFEPDLFKPGVVGSSVVLRAVRPPSLEFDPDLVKPGFSAAVSLAVLFKVEFKLVLEAEFEEVRVRFKLVLAAVVPVLRVVAVVFPTTLYRIFRSSSKFFYFSFILSAFETILL